MISYKMFFIVSFAMSTEGSCVPQFAPRVPYTWFEFCIFLQSVQKRCQVITGDENHLLSIVQSLANFGLICSPITHTCVNVGDSIQHGSCYTWCVIMWWKNMFGHFGLIMRLMIYQSPLELQHSAGCVIYPSLIVLYLRTHPVSSWLAMLVSKVLLLWLLQTGGTVRVHCSHSNKLSQLLQQDLQQYASTCNIPLQLF